MSSISVSAFKLIEIVSACTSNRLELHNVRYKMGMHSDPVSAPKEYPIH